MAKLPAVLIALAAAACTSGDPYALYERPGRMVAVRGGHKLSLYCAGKGSPTVILETGFGGGAWYAWNRLQPLLAAHTRTCSYDRAGYGFSEPGELPRDLTHFVSDLHGMLQASGEPGPYILAGHSNGGLIIGAFADLYPEEVAGLVFLDAAVALDEDRFLPDTTDSEQKPQLDRHLASIRRCLARMENATVPPQPAPGDECLPSEDLRGLPPAMAGVLAAALSKPAHWRAYLSEAEANYSSASSLQVRALLPHRWRRIPIRVVIANMGRAVFERRQERLCEFSSNCRIERVVTREHYVQNAAPKLVAGAVAGLVREAQATRSSK